MRIGLSISGRTPSATRRAAALADAAGLDLVALGDSQATLRDVYGLLALCAEATTRIALGPFVTNPLTRAPAVTAAAITTLDEIAGGRAYLGIGRGNASVLNAGMPRATPVELRRAIATIVGAMGAGGNEPLAWATRRVPIFVHIGGPRTAQVAVDLADGVIFRWGDIATGELEERLRELRRLRALGPRAGEPFEVWSVASACVTTSPATVGPRIDLAHRARSLPAAEWPAELAAAARSFRDAYDFAHHASKTSKSNKLLMDKLGLTDYILSRYLFIGDARTIGGRLREASALGVDTMVLAIEDSGERPATDEQRIGDAAAVRTAAQDSPSGDATPRDSTNPATRRMRG